MYLHILLVFVSCNYLDTILLLRKDSEIYIAEKFDGSDDFLGVLN